MKKLSIISFVIIVLVIILPRQIDAAENKGMFTLSSAEGRPGDTIAVSIEVHNNPGITALQLKINYLSQNLRLSGVEDKELFGNPISTSKESMNPFIISWYASDSEDKTNNGTLAVLKFEILKSAQDCTISISYDAENIFNSQLENKKFETKNGDVRVISPQAKKEYKVTYKDGTKTIKTEVIAGDKKLSLPSRTKKKYTFKGWYTKAKGGTKLTANTIIKDNITVFAQWKKVTVKIPKGIKVSAKKNGFAVKWSKVSGAKGYEIRYSSKANMKGAKKIIKSTNRLTKKCRKPAKNYYIQIRAYKIDSEHLKVYSAWSSKKY